MTPFQTFTRLACIGNARWTGVRLKDVLDRAGVKAGAVQVSFNCMDEPVVPDAPDFMKSLDIDHTRDGEVKSGRSHEVSKLLASPFRSWWTAITRLSVATAAIVRLSLWVSRKFPSSDSSI